MYRRGRQPGPFRIRDPPVQRGDGGPGQDYETHRTQTDGEYTNISGDLSVTGPPAQPIVSAPSEAWCILRGVSPRRVRGSHPPVSSVASVAEFRMDRDEQNRRSVHRESYRPQGRLHSLKSWHRSEMKLVPVAEGCNVRRRQNKIIRKGRRM